MNLKYQLALLEENGIEYATDIVLDRLNSINLLPYIQRTKRIFKASDQLYSEEWKYYAPVENKKYPSLFLILDTYLKILIIKQSKLI